MAYVRWRVIILPIFSSHYSIAHIFVTLETKLHVNDIIIASTMCIKLVQVKHQLSPMAIYYQPAVHFVTPIIAQFQYFLP